MTFDSSVFASFDSLSSNPDSANEACIVQRTLGRTSRGAGKITADHAARKPLKEVALG